MKRVVVTGIGLVTPLGCDRTEFTENLKLGKSGVSRISRFDPSRLSSQIAGEVKNFEPEKTIDKKTLLRMDRFTKYGAVAALQAWKDSGLQEVDKNRVAVVIGSGNGGIETLTEEAFQFKDKGPSRISPFFIPMMINNMVAGQISILLEAKGISYTVVTACASGANAIGDGMHLIRHGLADVVVCGGSEAALTELSLGGFAKMKAVSTRNDEPEKASRPFDKDRDGFVMGEGAGIVILESYESAKARGAKMYGEIKGYGRSSDAYHITTPAPQGEGAARCMQEALKDAGISPQDIDYINAHGTSTAYNDLYETMAIKKVFGEHAYRLNINSTKSLMGHLLGAAGAVECIAVLLQMEQGFIHPTINLEESEPELDLDYTPVRIEKQIETAISNSLGFGGHNTSLVIQRIK